MNNPRAFALAVCLVAAALPFAGCKKYKLEIASQKDEIAKLNQKVDGLSADKTGLEEKLASAEEDKRTLEGKIAELEGKIETTMGYVAELEASIAKLGGDKDAMSQKYQATLAEQQRLIDEMKKKQALAQARLDTLKGLLAKFKSLIAGGKLNVRIRDGKLMLELPSAVLFDSGKYEVSDDGMQTLQAVATVLAQIREREFQVAGHTDNDPVTNKQIKDNWALSTARAVAVVRALQSMGVSPKNLSASGYSEYRPTAPNDTKEHQAENRRIEIILMPNLNELPDLTSLEKELK